MVCTHMGALWSTPICDAPALLTLPENVLFISKQVLNIAWQAGHVAGMTNNSSQSEQPYFRKMMCYKPLSCEKLHQLQYSS